MDGIPAKCPTCSTGIPEGAVRCPGCGRVFGEDNRCPHCHAIAAVRPSGGGYVCLACGKPRDRLPQTTVLGEPDGRASLAPLAPRASGAAGTAGVAPVFAGAFAAGIVLALMGTSGVALALVALALAAGVGGGVALAGAERRRRRAAEEAAHRAIEQRILALAAKRSGDLTATDVASALRVPVAVADAALTRMSDGTKITAEVDESVGALHFVFHDLVPALPKTRVEVGGSESESESASESESESGSERESERAKARARD